MERQELFNTMMRAAVEYLQEEGLISTEKKESPERVSEDTKILQKAGLLPKK